MSHDLSVKRYKKIRDPQKRRRSVVNKRVLSVLTQGYSEAEAERLSVN